MPSMTRRLHDALDRALRPLSRRLPQTPVVDALYHRLLFIWKHGRLPRRDARLWNDVLFRVKTSDEILDPLRVFVTDKEFVRLMCVTSSGTATTYPRWRC